MSDEKTVADEFQDYLKGEISDYEKMRTLACGAPCGERVADEYHGKRMMCKQLLREWPDRITKALAEQKDEIKQLKYKIDTVVKWWPIALEVHCLMIDIVLETFMEMDPSEAYLWAEQKLKEEKAGGLTK